LKPQRPGHHFRKEERLCSVKSISRLFNEGQSLLVYPVKLVWIVSEIPQPFRAQSAFSVGKKNFPGAVDRNLLKRRMKEAYRLRKSVLYASPGTKNLHLVFLYIAREILPYKTIDKSVTSLMQKLILRMGRQETG